MMLEHLHLLLEHSGKTDLRIIAIKEGVRQAVPLAAKTAGHHPPPPPATQARSAAVWASFQQC